MAKNKKKNSNITPKMSINEILHYFKCFFEADEILKFATDRVAKDFLVFQSNRMTGSSETDYVETPFGIAQSWDEEAIEKIAEQRKKGREEEVKKTTDFIAANPQDVLKKNFKDIESVFIRCGNLDTYESAYLFEGMCKIVSSAEKNVRISDLLLYTAYRFQSNLYTFTRSAEVFAGLKYESIHGVTEVYDGKGDIFLSTDRKNFIRRSHQTFPEYVEPFNRKRMCSDSIKKMFKAQKELKRTVKKERLKKLSIKFKTGIREKFSINGDEYSFFDLENALQTRTVWQNIDFTHIDEWIEEGLITQEEIIKAFREGKILPRDLAIINELGIIPQITDATKDNSEVQKNRLFARLLLFSQDKDNIESIEAFLEKEPDQRDNISEEMLEELSWTFTNLDIRHSVYSLLVHDVLDFDQSMVLIDKLKDAERLKEDDEEFLKKGIHDFKVKQLENLVKSEAFDSLGGIGIGPVSEGRLTIDPMLRAQYFKDIGGVKSIFIDGSRLISDEDGGKSKNSLDGYQLLIFPNKGVAVLEKFFETIHKDGKVVYKKNKEGQLIPAIENATYVLPIEKAVEYATRKNKKGLRKIKNGRATVNHSKNWVKNLEAAMKDIAPQYAKFSPSKTNYWADVIKRDYEGRI